MIKPWTYAKKKPQKKQRKFIRQVSVKRQAALKEYKKVRDIFMSENPICQAPLCGKPSTELHHKIGKIGRLLTDQSQFSALCCQCHRMVHDQPEWARSVGLLPEIGGWNSIDRKPLVHKVYE